MWGNTQLNTNRNIQHSTKEVAEWWEKLESNSKMDCSLVLQDEVESIMQEL
jgi:hypothetical protein